MKILLYVLGFILFVNYRLFFTFLVHKTLYSFKEFTLRKDMDKVVSIILTIDILILAFYFLSVLTALILCVSVFTLNLIVKYVYQFVKKRRNDSKRG